MIVVLVVDDDDELRGAVAQVLEKAGFSVLEARDAAGALALLESAGAAVDVALVDVMLPGMSGSDLAKRLPARVILTSGYSEAEALAKGAGTAPAVRAFLQKPFSAKELLAAVRDATQA